MKAPLPSQLELATLASMMNQCQTPGGKVQAAIEIWEEAGRAIIFREKRERDIEEQVAKSKAREQENEDKYMKGIRFPAGTVSLETFLAKTIPGKITSEERMDIFRDFLAQPNPTSPGGIKELAGIKEHGIGEFYVYGFAMTFRRWLERSKENSRSAFHKNRSKAALLRRYGAKWAAEALAEKTAQTLEILIENTKRHTGRDRAKAQERVQDLIAGGLIVAAGKKLFSTPKD